MKHVLFGLGCFGLVLLAITYHGSQALVRKCFKYYDQVCGLV